MAKSIAENVKNHRIRRRAEYLRLFAKLNPDGTLACPNCHGLPQWENGVFNESHLDVYWTHNWWKLVYTEAKERVVGALESGEAVVLCFNCKEHKKTGRAPLEDQARKTQQVIESGPITMRLVAREQ